MNEKLVYLKPNVVIEPLFDRWYAWSHLISPATAAMNILSRHIAIMDSYLLDPDIHAETVRNPKMLGGPFMDYKEARWSEINALKQYTVQTEKDMLDLADAIRELDNLLANEAKGYSLEKMYERVPALLKGYVEIFYDRFNNPNFRFFESLLYKSRYYKKSSQSIALWITNNDERPFCLSTPRLNEPNVLHLNISFESPAIDMLSKMRRKPQTLTYIKDLLGIADSELPLFETFFFSDVPPAYQSYNGDKIRMRYFGHACILVETKDVSILVDPLVSYYGYYSDVEHFSDADLPENIDYVLITHNHQDHILFETLLPLRHRIKTLVVPKTSSGRLEDPNLKLMFTNIGFDNVIEIGEMEAISFSDTTITGIPFTGEHSDLNIYTKSCYLIQLSNFKLLFMADSRILEPSLYRNIQGQIGNVDVIFLGMECDGAPMSWLYGPLFTRRVQKDVDGSRRLSGSDCQKGMQLINIFKPKEVYVYAMGQEPWLEFISSIRYTEESNPIIQSNKLVNICIDQGRIAERLYGEKELLYDAPVNSTVAAVN